LRILITYPFPLERASGGARMTREIARHLARAGARVTVLPVAGRGEASRLDPAAIAAEEAALDADLAADGVEVERVRPHSLHWFLDGRAVRRAVARILDRETVDVVLSYFIEAAFLPALLERRGVRLGFISTWQSYAKALTFTAAWMPRPLFARVRDRLLGAPHRRAEVLYATSRFTRDELVEVLGVDPQRIQLCPLGVEARFLEIPRERPDAITRLLFFGRVIPSKGVGDAIEALGRLGHDGNARVTLRLRGQGDLDWARAVAREHGVEERVEVLGPADDAELRDELREAHLAVMPSHYEAFGLAFAEAQAAGLPVVAYRAGSVPEVVEDGVTGWLAPLHDVDALTACLRRALDDPAATHAAGLAGRERVQRLFTWEETARTILRGLERA
jgi:glycosyltransferase involved in cell wall biosynthesis